MSEVKELHGEEGIKFIGEMVKDIHIAMLVTASPDGSMDSRPMATQKADFDGKVWFLTRQQSGKVGEIRHDSHVTLVYADPADSKYVTMKGRADVSHDKAKIHELWNPMFKAWFPEGEDDPQIAVIRVEVQEAQYWQAPSSKIVYGVKYLAAAITGGKTDLGETGKVHL